MRVSYLITFVPGLLHIVHGAEDHRHIRRAHQPSEVPDGNCPLRFFLLQHGTIFVFQRGRSASGHRLHYPDRKSVFRNDLLLPLGVLIREIGYIPNVCADGAGGDGIDAHAVRRQIQRPAPGEVLRRRLGPDRIPPFIPAGNTAGDASSCSRQNFRAYPAPFPACKLEVSFGIESQHSKRDRYRLPFPTQRQAQNAETPA